MDFALALAVAFIVVALFSVVVGLGWWLYENDHPVLLFIGIVMVATVWIGYRVWADNKDETCVHVRQPGSDYIVCGERR